MRYLDRVQMVEQEAMDLNLPGTDAGFLTKDVSYFLLTLVGFAVLLAMLCMAGCGQKGSGGYDQAPGQSAALRETTITGSVREGATAASGARVYLLEMPVGGVGAAKSLLTAAVSGATLDAEGESTQGRYGVTADALGEFTMQGAYGCDPGATVYVSASQDGQVEARLLGVCGAAASVNSATGVRVDGGSTAALAVVLEAVRG